MKTDDKLRKLFTHGFRKKTKTIAANRAEIGKLNIKKSYTWADHNKFHGKKENPLFAVFIQYEFCLQCYGRQLIRTLINESKFDRKTFKVLRANSPTFTWLYRNEYKSLIPRNMKGPDIQYPQYPMKIYILPDSRE